MVSRAKLLSATIIFLLGPLPVCVYFAVTVDNFQFEDLSGIGFWISPYVFLIGWACRDRISAGHRVFVVGFACVLAIAGHYIIYKAFHPPVGEDPQHPLVAAAVLMYQWAAIVCAYPLACILFRFIRWLEETPARQKQQVDDVGQW